MLIISSDSHEGLETGARWTFVPGICSPGVYASRETGVRSTEGRKSLEYGTYLTYESWRISISQQGSIIKQEANNEPELIIGQGLERIPFTRDMRPYNENLMPRVNFLSLRNGKTGQPPPIHHQGRPRSVFRHHHPCGSILPILKRLLLKSIYVNGKFWNSSSLWSLLHAPLSLTSHTRWWDPAASRVILVRDLWSYIELVMNHNNDDDDDRRTPREVINIIIIECPQTGVKLAGPQPHRPLGEGWWFQMD